MTDGSATITIGLRTITLRQAKPWEAGMGWEKGNITRGEAWKTVENGVSLLN
jgi:hypothetical protein